MTSVCIRFEMPIKDRVSQDFGPYPWVQLTYEGLRVGPDGEWIAHYNNGYWELNFYEDLHEPQLWSDIIIYPSTPQALSE